MATTGYTKNFTVKNGITAGPITLDASSGNIAGSNVSITANLTVAGVSNLGVPGNVKITGGSDGQVLSTDGSGGLSFISISSSSISNGTSNVNIATANGSVTTTVGGSTKMTISSTGASITGTLSTSGNATVGNLVTSGTGGNITGANVISANRLNIANASAAIYSNNYGYVGDGQLRLYANTNTLKSSLILDDGYTAGGGSGPYSGVTLTANTDITLFTNTADTPFSWSFNQDGTTTMPGTLSATGNITTPQFISNVVTGTPPLVVTSTTQVANLNVATAGSATTAGTVTANAQANITSVGNLASLTVVGNITAPRINIANSNAAIFSEGLGEGLTFYADTFTEKTGLILADPSGASLFANTGITLITNWNETLTPPTWFFNQDGTTSMPGDLSVIGDVSVSGGVNAGTIDVTNDITTSNGVFIGNGSGLTSLTGANVTGTVPSATTATTATTASTVTNNAQPNITSTGTLTSLAVTGLATVGNISTTNLVATGTGSFGANVNMAGFAINNVLTPVQDQDAVTKLYVDTLVSSGISYHAAVNVATTTTLAVATGGTTAYNSPNGAANGIGAYISTTGTYTLIDGVNIATIGRRILVKNEANGAWNGIYTYANSTAIVRATDADEPGTDATQQISINDYFFCQAGTVNNGVSFIVSAPATAIIFGTSTITFSVFSSSVVYTAGTGIAITGTVISANASQTQVTAVGTLAGLSVTGTISATGTIRGANLTTGGNLSVTANANVGNIGTSTAIITTGNITTINSGLLQNGNSNVTLTANANVAIFVAGNATARAVFTSTGVNVAGTLSATGTITGGNLTTGGTLSATGSATVGSLTTGGTLSATGSATVGSLTTGGTVSATGTITGGNLTTGGNLSVTANANVGNIGTSTAIITTGNITTINSGLLQNGNSNVTLTANANVAIFVAGNATARAVFTSTGVNVAGTLSVTGSANVGNLGTGGFITATGNITGGNLIGNNLTAGRVAFVGATKQITDDTELTYNPTTNILSVTTGNITGGNISVTGNITASQFIGNGSQLTGLITNITPNALSSTVHIAAVTTGTTANIITDATTANTANTIVVRDQNGSITIGSFAINARTSNANYALTINDYWLGFTLKNLTATLPNIAGGAVQGRQYLIADVTASTGTSGIQILAQAGVTVYGGTLDQQGQSKTCVFIAAELKWYCN